MEQYFSGRWPVPENTTHSPRRFSCRLDEVAVVIDLGTDERPNVLYLTHDEAERLASDLKAELVCAGAEFGDEPQGHFPVADVIVTSDEALRLVDAIEDLLRLHDAE